MSYLRSLKKKKNGNSEKDENHKIISMNRFIKVLKNKKRELQSNKQFLWNKNH